MSDLSIPQNSLQLHHRTFRCSICGCSEEIEYKTHPEDGLIEYAPVGDAFLFQPREDDWGCEFDATCLKCGKPTHENHNPVSDLYPLKAGTKVRHPRSGLLGIVCAHKLVPYDITKNLKVLKCLTLLTGKTLPEDLDRSSYISRWLPQSDLEVLNENWLVGRPDDFFPPAYVSLPNSPISSLKMLVLAELFGFLAMRQKNPSLHHLSTSAFSLKDHKIETAKELLAQMESAGWSCSLHIQEPSPPSEPTVFSFAFEIKEKPN